jgi:hypothetical protein
MIFLPRFTHRGVESSRRVFIDGTAFSFTQPSFMRDWKPSDASKCGIFGMLVSDTAGLPDNGMCLPTSPSTHYCCMVDVAVAPLYHLFYNHPYVLDELDAVCNRPYSPTATRSRDTSYPIFSKARVLSLVQKIGRYYAVPKGKGQDETIKLHMGMLNDLLHEFSPPQGKCVTCARACCTRNEVR